MTQAIELAKAHGIAYYLTPEKTTEMHGTDRQIEAFAEAIRTEEREACAEIVDHILKPYFNGKTYGDFIRERSNAGANGLPPER